MADTTSSLSLSADPEPEHFNDLYNFIELKYEPPTTPEENLAEDEEDDKNSSLAEEDPDFLDPVPVVKIREGLAEYFRRLPPSDTDRSLHKVQFACTIESCSSTLTFCLRRRNWHHFIRHLKAVHRINPGSITDTRAAPTTTDENIKLPEEFIKYFRQVSRAEDSEDEEDEDGCRSKFKFRCIINSCGGLLTYCKHRATWGNLRRHLKNVHQVEKNTDLSETGISLDESSFSEFLLPGSVILPKYLQKYFHPNDPQPIDNVNPTWIKFTCLEDSCGSVLNYSTRRCNWSNFRRHLTALHQKNFRRIGSTTKNPQFEEVDLSPGERIDPALVRIRKDLQPYFGKITEPEYKVETGTGTPNAYEVKLKCLIDSCNQIINYSLSQRTWRSFVRHLNTAHGIIVKEKTRSKSKSGGYVETEEIQLHYDYDCDEDDEEDEEDEVEFSQGQDPLGEVDQMLKLQANVPVRADLKQYFRQIVPPVGDGSEIPLAVSDKVRFMCLLEPCHQTLSFCLKERTWSHFFRHLKTVHKITTLGKNSISKSEDEIGQEETMIADFPSTSKMCQASVEKSMQSNLVTIREDLRPYFRQNPPELDADLVEKQKVRFICLQESCNRALSFCLRERNSFPLVRHLKIVHNIHTTPPARPKPKPKSKSKSVRFEVKPEVSCDSYPENIQSPEFQPFVKLTRLNFEDLPKMKKAKNSNDEDFRDHDFDACCIICGRRASAGGLKNKMPRLGPGPSSKSRSHKRGTSLDKAAREFSAVIWKLLNIPESQQRSEFINFFEDGQYCLNCCAEVETLSEDFAALDRIQKRISEGKKSIENLFRKNYEEEGKGKAAYPQGMKLVHWLDEKIKPTAVKKVQSPRPRKIDEIVRAKSERNDDDDDMDWNPGADDLDHDPDWNYGVISPPPGNEVEVTTSENIDEVIPHKCTFENCPKIFRTAKLRNTHLNRVHLKRYKVNRKNTGLTYKCTQCSLNSGIDKVFKTRRSLVIHQTKHSGNYKPQKWMCEICGKTMSSQSCIRRHKAREHSNEDLPQCGFCSLIFPTIAEHDDHVLYHKIGTPYHCVLCKILTTSSVELKRHMAEVHWTECGAKRWPCEWKGGGCDKYFTSAKALEIHMERHKVKAEGIGACAGSDTHAQEQTGSTASGSVWIKCSEPGCNVICLGKSQLDLHMPSHSKQAQCICDECGRSFKHKRSLIVHQERHIVLASGGKFKHECKICGKTFQLIKGLHKHEEIHSGIQHTCEICGKSFGTTQGLEQHLRTHGKKYPHELKRLSRNPRTKNKKPQTSKTKVKKSKRNAETNDDDSSDEDDGNSTAQNVPSKPKQVINVQEELESAISFLVSASAANETS